MWKLNVFAILLLGSCGGVLSAYAEEIAPEETTIKSDVDEVTLSTELRPPPLPAADGEYHGIVYLINLLAVKNKTGESPGRKSENDLELESPEVIGSLASLLVIVDDGDEEGPLDGLTKLLVDADYEVEDTDSENGLKKDVKTDFDFSAALKAEVDKLRRKKKIRSKRTVHRKNRGCESSGGYDGNYGGGSQQDYNVYVIPIGGGQGGRQNYGGGQYHGGGGGQNIPYHPHQPQHPGGEGGGGNQWGNGGEAHAYAEAHAGAYGG